MDDLLETQKRESLPHLVERCRSILRQRPGKKRRLDAFWAEKRLGKAVDRAALKLDKEDPFGISGRVVLHDISRGAPVSNFVDAKERKLAELALLQLELIREAVQHDDPMGAKGAWDGPAKRRPPMNGYDIAFLRSLACLVARKIGEHRSYSACWETRFDANKQPPIPKSNGSRMLPARAAEILLNIMRAESAPEGWHEGSLRQVKGNARRSMKDFGLSIAALKDVASS